jgi:predicted pyridoxine 5'-phosphate oxidase superfamily flavin-nucleotide-binding protein
VLVLDHRATKAFETAAVCWLATCVDGLPNVVPVGFKALWGDQLLLVDLFLGKTRDNLIVNPGVAVSVATTHPKAGFQFKGRAAVHRDGPAYQAARDVLLAQGVAAAPHAAIVVAVSDVYALDPGEGAGRRLPRASVG